MNGETHYRKLERMYLEAAPIQQLYPNTTMKITQGAAEISLPLRTEYFHAAMSLHGSVYFRMLDDAAFFAAQSLEFTHFILTSNFNIQLLRPVRSGTITAKGKVKHPSSRLFIAEAELFDEKGRLVAFGTGNFMKSKFPISEEIGYK